jgi:glutathione S-transferase
VTASVHDTAALFRNPPLQRAMATITLYELPGCPYCAKVIDKLNELGIEYDSVEVPRSHDDRTEVKEVSGQTGVPVIVDEDHGVDGMAESDDIVEYLEETYGN